MSRLDFTLTAPQSKAFRILQSPVVDLNLEWGRGCGKSKFDRLIAWLWTARADGVSRLDLLAELGVADRLTASQKKMASQVQGVRVVFLMPTLKQYKDVHGSGIKSEVVDWTHLDPTPNWSDWKISFPGGSWMQPFPAADHSSQRARGIRCDIVIADECDDIEPSVFDAIVRPWFSEPWSLKIRLTSGTYKRGRFGLLYKRRLAGRDPKKPRYHTIHATYADNPEIVDAEEVEDARRNTNPETFAREWECDPDSAEGIIYPFREDFHVRLPPSDITWTEMLIGCDHGDEHPGALILIGVLGSGADATCWILDEIYERRQVESWWLEQGKKWFGAYPNHYFYGDPSMPARIRAYKNAGARVRDCDNSVEDGISAVADRMFVRTGDNGDEFAKLYIHPKCVNTIREFGLYRRKKDPRNAEAFLEDIDKRNDDAMDAIRYPIFNRFGPAGPSSRAFSRYDQR